MKDIERLPTGAIPDPPDPRDLQLGFVAGAAVVDWDDYVRLPEPPDENQGSSSSCVSQAWSYYHWQLKGKDYSRRDVYSQIYLKPSGGAFLRDGGKTICSVGQQTRDECGDPHPQTESNMRFLCAEAQKAADDIEASYYLAGEGIDAVARCVRDFKGCVFGIGGSNKYWQDLTNPQPVPAGEAPEWFHALYAMGFHMHDGKKCIIAKSSWCRSGHHEHHINEDHFALGRVFNAWVLVPKENLPVYDRYIVLHQPTGRLGVLVVGQTGFSDSIVWAKNAAMLDELKKQIEVPASAPTITLSA